MSQPATVTLTGPFDQDDIRTLMETFRALEQRQPSETFTMTVIDPKGSLKEGEDAIRSIIPNARIVSLKGHIH